MLNQTERITGKSCKDARERLEQDPTDRDKCFGKQIEQRRRTQGTLQYFNGVKGLLAASVHYALEPLAEGPNRYGGGV
jgi:hypothetical protein